MVFKINVFLGVFE